ncbi:MAG TPA: signal peptide peptidase SppA [Roseiflexaceae bacterium]|nr:signal peptide peptidase SppA [Roseiflexaceae bacterium]
MQQRGWLIAISIIVGILLVCVALPFGTLLLMLAIGSGDSLPASADRVWQERVISGSGNNRVVVIDVAGVIGSSEADIFSSQITHQQLISQIRQARRDPNVKAVVIAVDSPGGGVVASSELHGEITALREAGKWVVISMGSVAASGGYYIATAGERIYAHPDTLTGSLGVIIATLNYEEAFEKLGLRQEVYKSGEFKDIGSPAREATPAEIAIIQAIVDEVYQGFVDVIVEGRQLPREEVLALADGRLYTGRQAFELNLIDELGDLEDAIDGAKDLAGLSDALVVRYGSAVTLRDLLVANLAKNLQPADPFGVRAVLRESGPRLEYRLLP